MNTKTTVVLALVCVVVFAYLMFVEKPWQSEPVEEAPVAAEERGEPLFDPRPDPKSVDRVEIEEDDGRSFVFVRDEENGWDLAVPIEARASKFEIDALVDALCNIRYVQVFEPRDRNRPSPTTTGLAEPSAFVRLLADGKPVVALNIGARVPTGSGNYLSLVDDDRIFVSRDTLSDRFGKRLADYRDKRILDFQLADVQRVKVEGVRHFELVRQDAEEWLLEAPFRGPADKSKVENVVRPLTYLRADAFIDDEPLSPRLYGLETPQLTVTVETEKTIPAKAKPGEPDTQPADTQPSVAKDTYVLHVGSAADVGGERYFARLAGEASIFTVRQDTFNTLTPEVTDLLRQRIAPVDAAKVRKIELSNAGGSMTLTKDAEGHWRFEEDGETADDAAVSNLVKAVSDLTASEYINPETTLAVLDWQNPRARVVLTQERQLTPVTVLVGSNSAGGQMTYVRNQAAEAVAAVRAEAVAPLLEEPIAYRVRRIFSFDPVQANQIEILRKGAAPVRVQRFEREWRMIAPVEAAADEENVRSVLQNFATLTARRVVGTGDLASYGLDDAELSVAVTTIVFPDPPAEGEAGDTATQPAAAEDTAESEQPTTNESAHVDHAKPDAPSAEEQEPEVIWYILNLSRQGDVVYAVVAGEQTVYEMDSGIYDDLTAEMHDRTVIGYLTGHVTEMAFTADGQTMTLRKVADGQWRYEEDPLVPIDTQKVEDIIKAFQGFQTHRYVDYEAEDLAAYGLEDEAARLRIDLEDGGRYEVLLSKQGPAGDPQNSRFAVLAGTRKVFLLTGEQAARFAQKLEDVEKNPA